MSQSQHQRGIKHQHLLKDVGRVPNSDLTAMSFLNTGTSVTGNSNWATVGLTGQPGQATTMTTIFNCLRTNTCGSAPKYPPGLESEIIKRILNRALRPITLDDLPKANTTSSFRNISPAPMQAFDISYPPMSEGQIEEPKLGATDQLITCNGFTSREPIHGLCSPSAPMLTLKNQAHQMLNHSSSVEPLGSQPRGLHNFGPTGETRANESDSVANQSINQLAPISSIHPPNPVGFKPSRMLRDLEANRNQTLLQGAQSPTLYRGDPVSVSALREVPNLPAAENCTLFLTNIPAHVHESQIFDKIRFKHGAVFCLHMHHPTSRHPTCAAKLSFMEPEGAARFMEEVNSAKGIWLGGYRLLACYNRVSHGRHIFKDHSRVLIIEGPKHHPTVKMNANYWLEYFAKVCCFKLDRWRVLPSNKPGKIRMEFRFVRVDGQAQSCLQAITKHPSYIGVIQAWFGQDPCGQESTRT